MQVFLWRLLYVLLSLASSPFLRRVQPPKDKAGSRSSMGMCPYGCSVLAPRLPKTNNFQMLWKLLAASTSPAAFAHLRVAGAEADSPPAVLHVSRVHQSFAYYDKSSSHWYQLEKVVTMRAQDVFQYDELLAANAIGSGSCGNTSMAHWSCTGVTHQYVNQAWIVL